MNDPHYPDDIRKYDIDPRSPFYDSSFEDAKDQFILDKVTELFNDPSMVNEGLGELDGYNLSEIGKHADKSMWVSSPLDSDMWAMIGRKITNHLADYFTELAETEWENELKIADDDFDDVVPF